MGLDRTMNFKRDLLEYTNWTIILLTHRNEMFEDNQNL